MKPLLALGPVVVTFACAAWQNPVPGETASEEVTPATAITLERTACFGRCPVYRLAVTAEGVVSYEGTANVKVLGKASGQVSPKRVEELVKEFDGAGYFSFASRYTAAEQACGRYVTDNPSAITSVSFRGQSKRIEHDQGCGAAPGALVALERRIDEVLQSGQWTGR